MTALLVTLLINLAIAFIFALFSEGYRFGDKINITKEGVKIIIGLALFLTIFSYSTVAEYFKDKSKMTESERLQYEQQQARDEYNSDRYDSTLW